MVKDQDHGIPKMDGHIHVGTVRFCSSVLHGMILITAISGNRFPNHSAFQSKEL